MAYLQTYFLPFKKIYFFFHCAYFDRTGKFDRRFGYIKEIISEYITFLGKGVLLSEQFFFADRSATDFEKLLPNTSNLQE